MNPTLAAYQKALKRIAEMLPERDEWDGAEKYALCQKIAHEVLTNTGVKHNYVCDE